MWVCPQIILVSLVLIILPSFSPFSRHSSTDDDYRPTGVISRTILTDSASSQPPADVVDGPAVLSDSISPPSDLRQSKPADGAATLQGPIESPKDGGVEGTAGEGRRAGNSSSPAAGQTEPPAHGLKGSRDPAKPAHADEM